MKSLTLFRGIAVAEDMADEVVQNTKDNGLSWDERARWRFETPDIQKVRSRIDSILSKDNPAYRDIYGETPHIGLCCCGDEDGGRFYAVEHNRTQEKTVSILIKFKASIEDVFVDHRDFLWSAFIRFDFQNIPLLDRQSVILRKVYGNGVIRYIDRCRTENFPGGNNIRVVMCHLAAFDEKLALDHYRNKKMLAGRYGTRFRSAFFVKTPVLSSSIEKCWIVGDSTWTESDIFANVYEDFR
jgi:hypothetical protein